MVSYSHNNNEGAEMNIKLGRGGKVHAANVHEGYMPAPKCGGNRAVEGYREVSAEVDCKNCLKIIADEAEAATPETPEVETSAEGLKFTRGTSATGITQYVAESENFRFTIYRAEAAPGYWDVAINRLETIGTIDPLKVAGRALNGLIGTSLADAKAEAEKYAAEHQNEGETTVTETAVIETQAFDRARAEGADHAEAAEVADRAAKATPAYAYRTVHPVSGKSVRIPSSRPAKWAAWEGAKLFGLANSETEAEAISGLPKGREFVVTAISPISPRKGAESGIIARDVPVNAGTATTERNTEMPPTKRAAAKKTAKAAEAAPVEETPKAAPTDTEDAIQRVRDITAQVLAVAEVGESADPERIKELADSAEAIIAELPMEHRTGLRAALEEAKRGESYTAEGHGKDGKKKTASKAVSRATAQSAASRETQDYKQAIPDAENVVADVAAAYAKGVEFERENSNAARSIAEKVLAARLFLSDKDGHPDYNGKSNAAKVLSGVVYAAAGSGFERTEENEDALDRLVKSVQNLRNDVLVKYVRNISKEDAHRFFPKAFAADPEADPTKAIQTFYKIPERSTFEIQAEKRRLERAQRKALAAGKEKEAKELGEAIKTVGKAEDEGGEGEGEAAAAPKTAAEKRKAKHLAAIEAATEKFADLEKEIEKIDAAEAAELVAKLEAFNGMSATLTAMLKGKTA